MLDRCTVGLTLKGLSLVNNLSMLVDNSTKMRRIQSIATTLRGIQMAYTIREKLAYSKAGKIIATIIRNRMFPNSRVHWVQQALADLHFSNLR